MPQTPGFAYKNLLHTVRFVDNMNEGTVHLYRDEQEVIGLDIFYESWKGDAANWRWSNVIAFQPGPWMKDLLEIAGHIEASRWRKLEQQVNSDNLSRARRIRLPK